MENGICSADMRRFDVSTPGICMKFRPVSNGIGVGAKQKTKKSVHLYKLRVNPLPQNLG